jgi:hypothetical protein
MSGHVPWKTVYGIEPHRQTPFGIDTNEKRHFRLLLVTVGQFGLPARTALQEQ